MGGHRDGLAAADQLDLRQQQLGGVVQRHVRHRRDLADDRLGVVRLPGEPPRMARVQPVPRHVHRDGPPPGGHEVGDDLAPAPRTVPETMH